MNEIHYGFGDWIIDIILAAGAKNVYSFVQIGTNLIVSSKNLSCMLSTSAKSFYEEAVLHASAISLGTACNFLFNGCIEYLSFLKALISADIWLLTRCLQSLSVFFDAETNCVSMSFDIMQFVDGADVLY